jgi:ribosomal protein S18 acetylase RimI-like enzyme
MTAVALPAVTLRPAAEEDREFLLQVYGTTRQDEMAMVPWSDEEKRAFLRMQAEAQDASYRQGYPEARFLVVATDGRDIGRLYRWERDDELHLIDIALLPEWRNRGIGSSLMEGLLAEADRRGMRVTLYVEHWNPARRLYDRLGFEAVSADSVYARLERRPARSLNSASS